MENISFLARFPNDLVPQTRRRSEASPADGINTFYFKRWALEEGHPVNAPSLSTGRGTPKLAMQFVFKNTAKLMKDNLLTALTSPPKHGAGQSTGYFCITPGGISRANKVRGAGQWLCRLGSAPF